MDRGRCIAKPEIRCPYYHSKLLPICEVCRHYKSIDYVEEDIPLCIIDLESACIHADEDISLQTCVACELGGFRRINESIRGKG